MLVSIVSAADCEKTLTAGQSISVDGYTILLNQIVLPASNNVYVYLTLSPSFGKVKLNTGIENDYYDYSNNKILKITLCYIDGNSVGITAETEPINTCTSTDDPGLGGYLLTVKGTVTQNGAQYTDYCTGSGYIVEYYCNTNYELETLQTPCDNGYECSNGACVKAEKKCTDSDGGKNIYVKGTATGTLENGVYTTAVDSCSSNTQVLERYCDGNTLKVTDSDGEFCPSGYVCSDGACVAQQTQEYCSDNDGSNIYTKGSVTNQDGQYSDFCTADGTLMETWCKNGKKYTTGYTCPSNYICSNGACVQEQSQGTDRYCEEADGGYNLYTKSTATLYSDSQKTSIVSIGTDYCESNTKVHEYWCTYYSNGELEGLVTGFSYDCPTGYKCSDGACVSTPTEEEICGDGVDNDNDGYSDCFDADCDNNCVLKEHNPTCCLYHNLEYATYAEDFTLDMCTYPKEYGFSVEHAGRYPVLNENECKNAALVFGYSYAGKEGATNTESNCKDSDGGIDEFTKGTAKGIHLISGEQVEYTDHCTVVQAGLETDASEYIAEFFCTDGYVYQYYLECPSGYTCEKGECVSESDVPPLPEETETYTVNLKKGWNLISSPVAVTEEGRSTAKVIESTCDTSKIFAYDQSSKSYIYDSYSLAEGGYVPVPDAFWVKVNEPCKVTFEGAVQYDYEHGLDIQSGWVAIGSPYSSTNYEDILGDCTKVSGPWRFNPSAWKWEKAETLKPGEGYFLKVSGACTLGTGVSPPTLPE